MGYKCCQNHKPAMGASDSTPLRIIQKNALRTYFHTPRKNRKTKANYQQKNNVKKSRYAWPCPKLAARINACHI
jgi:hypothetical protein